MGKVYSHLAWRVSRNFNVENRAQKVLSQEVIRPAPKHKSDEEYLSKIRQEHPELSAQIENKDEGLLKRLENVYVKSKDPSVTEPDRSAHKLPQDRTPHEPARFGYEEPERVPYGRVTLRSALSFLGAHAQAPADHPASSIARDFKLDEQVTDDILKHFKMLQMQKESVDGQVEQINWSPSETPLSELDEQILYDLNKVPQLEAQTPPGSAGKPTDVTGAPVEDSGTPSSGKEGPPKATPSSGKESPPKAPSSGKESPPKAPS